MIKLEAGKANSVFKRAAVELLQEQLGKVLEWGWGGGRWPVGSWLGGMG